ncbi:MAG: cell wall synthesis protein CwsA [Actinomycetota bacterium]|nr:cell wall synthesis protein CwsA [Actinomycetota bacterium]
MSDTDDPTGDDGNERSGRRPGSGLEAFLEKMRADQEQVEKTLRHARAMAPRQPEHVPIPRPELDQLNATLDQLDATRELGEHLAALQQRLDAAEQARREQELRQDEALAEQVQEEKRRHEDTKRHSRRMVWLAAGLALVISVGTQIAFGGASSSSQPEPSTTLPSTTTTTR